MEINDPKILDELYKKSQLSDQLLSAEDFDQQEKLMKKFRKKILQRFEQITIPF